MFDFLDLINICFKKREDFREVNTYVLQHLDLLNGLLTELEDAISLFNKFNSSQKIFDNEEFLINAKYTKEVLSGKKLPYAGELLSEIASGFKLKAEFEKEFSTFEFITEMTDYQQLLCCTVVAFYRTYMLVKEPDLKEKKVQIASTIEEMLTIMYLQKHDTYLFQGVKHWVLDYKAEGFSKDLANLINS